MKKGLKHAFAVDPPGPAQPTPEQQEPVDWFCKQVARRHLTTPALISLEMFKPLGFMGSQVMHFFSPGVWALARQQTLENYNQFAKFLENRGAIDYLCARIEHFEAEFDRQERMREATRRSKKAAPGRQDVASSHEED